MSVPANALQQRFGDEDRIRKGFAAQVRLLDDGDVESRTLSFLVSTQDVDRHGDTIDPEGWELDNFKKNPVVLWAHSQWSPPVAKASNTTADVTGLRSDATFTTRDENPMGDMAYRLYKGGFMHAVSVGFRTLEWTVNEERPGWLPMDISRAELVEWSAVPVPSNPEALIAAKAAGIDTTPAIEWASQLLDLHADDEKACRFLNSTRKAAGASALHAVTAQLTQLAQRVDAIEATRSAQTQSASKDAEPTKTSASGVIVRLVK